MNLVIRYIGIGIEGIPVPTLKSILAGTHETKVTVATNGLIRLSDGKIIKCVKDYYAVPNMKPIKKMSNQCYYVQQALGVRNVPNNACSRCHLACANRVEEGTMFRKG